LPFTPYVPEMPVPSGWALLRLTVMRSGSAMDACDAPQQSRCSLSFYPAMAFAYWRSIA